MDCWILIDVELQVRLHPPEEALAPAFECGVSLPADVVGENSCGIEAGLATKVSECCETLERILVEQLTAGPLHLGRPEHSPSY
jgi:hypothetical protein